MRQGDLETYQKLLPQEKWRRERRRERIQGREEGENTRERRRERIHRAWNRGKVVVEKEKICFL